jgi:hypothetical protein
MLCLYIGAAQKIVMFTFFVVSANYFAWYSLFADESTQGPWP